jgi:hypothetical protein
MPCLVANGLNPSPLRRDGLYITLHEVFRLKQTLAIRAERDLVSREYYLDGEK